MSYYYTTHEVTALKAAYPAGGILAACEALPGRSRRAIFAQARRLGLKAPKAGRRHRQSCHHTPETDARIKAAYEGGRLGAISAISHDTGWNHDSIRRRAIELGVYSDRSRNRPWSEAEETILQDHAHLTDRIIAGRWKKAGYHRTATAVKVHRTRMGISTREEKLAAGIHTTVSLAQALGVSQKVVERWIAQGLLKATKQPAANGGDGQRLPYEIKERDVREFVVRYPHHLDLRKAHPQRHWLIALIAGA
jgi:hypothetical protein